MIDVLITFDTEFSIGGALTHPEKYAPLGADYVWLESDGVSLGLGYILDQLKIHGLNAVFFTEACNAAYHGPDEMGDIARTIRDAGQDVQLHIHPAWLYFSTQRSWPKNDSCAGRSVLEMQEVIEYAIGVYNDWLQDTPLAIRTGSLKVDSSFYSALKKSGLSCSSSIGMSVYAPLEDKLKLMSGTAVINDVVELPVSTSGTIIGRELLFRSLQIQSCSFQEIKYSLDYALKKNISPVVILSHPFEFVKASDFRYQRYIKNVLVRRRFEQICEYLSSNADRFRVVGISDCLSKLNKNSCKKNDFLRVPAWSVFKRMIENKFSDFALNSLLRLR